LFYLTVVVAPEKVIESGYMINVQVGEKQVINCLYICLPDLVKQIFPAVEKKPVDLVTAIDPNHERIVSSGFSKYLIFDAHEKIDNLFINN
jgi:hypothetical protein